MTLDEVRQYFMVEHIRGSHLFNLNTEKSDIDLGGIFKLPQKYFLQLHNPPEEVSDEKHDTSYYELKRYINLACTANPTVLESLYIPDQFIKFKTREYDYLVENRSLFITKKCYWSYSGYAYAQIKKASGKNKKVHSVEKYVNEEGVKLLKKELFAGKITPEWVKVRFNEHFYKFLVKGNSEPVSEETSWKVMDQVLEDENVKFMLSPRREAFCYFVATYLDSIEDDTFSRMPFRPSNNFDASTSDCSSVEHMPNLFRVYRNGAGIFKNNQMTFTSIPKEREWADFIGVMSYNADDYMKSNKEYLSFWEWCANRNENRWQNDWDKEQNYDCKNMLHTCRLLLEAEYIVKTGELHTYFEGKERDWLMSIRSGKLEYDFILHWADQKLTNLKEQYEKSNLPDQVNMHKINDLYMNLMK